MEEDERRISRALNTLAGAAGLHVRLVGHVARLSTHGGVSSELDLVYVPRLREGDVADLARRASSSTRPLLFTTDLLDKGVLRSAPELGINVVSPHAAHIDVPGVFVHIAGPIPTTAPRRPTGSARTLFALLRHREDRFAATAASLSRAAGTPPGTVRRYLSAFARQGWVAVDGPIIEILDRTAMLEG